MVLESSHKGMSTKPVNEPIATGLEHNEGLTYSTSAKPRLA